MVAHRDAKVQRVALVSRLTSVGCDVSPLSAVCGCEQPPLTLEIQRARRELSRFIADDAAKMRDRVGFGWVARPDAPSTYSDLRDAFVWSLGMREPLPVSSLNNTSVVTSPSTNLAFRFAHDVKHILFDLSFNLDDETELAVRHLDELREETGVSACSLVHRLYHADTLGQVQCLAMLGRFPHDQLRFALRALKYGVDGAVELEGRPCCHHGQSSIDHPVDEITKAA